jgi:ankyrin repeat protein
MASSSIQSSVSSEAAVKGETLFKAAEAGNINEVTRLLGKKADITYMYKWMFDGGERASTPLMAAVVGGHAEVVKFLITRKANVNLAEPINGLTSLHFASIIENFSMIELLMSKGAKHEVRDKVGNTPLHFAAFNGNKESMACLLDHGADINAADIIGDSPLMMAASDGLLETVKLLVLRGADMKKTAKGLTALDLVAYEGRGCGFPHQCRSSF